MKKILTLIVLISVMFSSFNGASASSLGTLSNWDSTHSQIGRWGTTFPTIWAGMADDSITTANFTTSVNHAMSQWGQAGINTGGVNELSQATIRIHGGKYDNLKKMQTTLLPDDTGLTVFSGQETVEGTWKYGNSDKTGFRLKGQVKVFIVQRSGKSLDGYKKTTTHELGHALGWIGHSSNSSDIMYFDASEVTNLTTRDKRHLKQVY